MKDEYKHRQQLGIAHAKQFSWARAAKETIAVYDKVLGKA